jgi:hypothetical protein
VPRVFFDFRMTAPDPEQSAFGCQSIRELLDALPIHGERPDE